MKKSQIVGLLVVGACLAIGFGSWWWLVWVPKVEAKERIVELQKRVLATLSDPDSAKFQDVRFAPETGAGCGMVNARNRMGGYVGFTAFVAPKTGGVIFSPGGNSETGDAGERVEVLTKQIEFLKFMLASCPEKASPQPKKL